MDPALGTETTPRQVGGFDDLADLSAWTPQAEARVAAALGEMELVSLGQYRTVVAPAERAEQLATEWDLPGLRLRARLVLADALLRDGDAVQAGRIAEQARVWATEHGDAHLLARSHRQLSLFFYHVGDVSDAFAHAVQCVATLAEDAPARVRAKHLAILGMVAYDAGAPEDAHRWNSEGLDIATAIGDGDLALQILNNMAYTACLSGEHERAEHHIDQIHAVVARHDSALGASVLDTIARIQVTRGRYAEAEATLRPFLDGSAAHLVTEANGLAECLLTVAEAQRRRGDVAAAQASLDRAAEVCAKRGLASAGARVREELAHLYAATGRYKEAYEEYRLFHAEIQTVQSAQREARARALQAVYETEEARRESLRFRELAQRDALTGLYNRRFVDEHLPVLLEQGAPVSVALVDLDHFKRINDTLSHAVGDLVLQEIATLLTAAAAEDGIAARLGGEEFVVVFPATGPQEAVRRCERLRQEIAAHPWRPVTGEIPVTASIGVTTVSDGQTTPSALLVNADRNLYAAKRSGRNRVIADPA